MENILLTSFKEADLKKLFREVLEEKIKKESKKKESCSRFAYMNRFEVAKLLKISLPTLNNWSKSGIVQSYRIGNRILYKAEEIDQAIKAVKNLKYKRG